VQYLKPAKKRSQYPIILVHGGAGQGTHFMGLNGMAGWAHYFVQAGYDTYVIDRPGHGRAVYHPDFYGEATPVYTFQSVLPLINEGAKGRWMGSGQIDDPLVMQFQAGQNSIPKDMGVFKKYYESGAGQLLDKIGPSIILAHSMGGPWPYIAAATRPGKVKAILDVEGMSPFGAPWNVPVSSLKGVPITCIQAEKSSIKIDATVKGLKDGGCDVVAINLKDKGVLGNGHFMMFEDNRKQVFDAIQKVLEARVKV
jgi:pimeloyl-ACP methyl ester carboxylesterase